MIDNNFSAAMSKRNDEELIRIVTVERGDYQLSAVEAAENEIKKRGINTAKFEELKSIVASKFEEQKVLETSIVSSWTRLLHLIVDSVAFILLSMILSFVITTFFKTKDQTIWNGTEYAIIIISFFVYYIFMEHKFQRTLGKFISKTRVVMKDGQRAQLGDIIRRTCFRLIPLDQFSYLFTRIGFHDYLSNTTVVREIQGISLDK